MFSRFRQASRATGVTEVWQQKPLPGVAEIRLVQGNDGCVIIAPFTAQKRLGITA